MGWGVSARTISADTRQALQALSHECDSLRKTAKVLQVPHSLLSDILGNRHGHVSLANENRIRAVLNLPPLPAPVPIPPCPDCGSVHHARCHGNGGACVVLAQTERVVTARPPAKRPRRLVRPVATPTQNSRRLALGDTWRAIIEAGLAAREAVSGGQEEVSE